MQHMLSNVNLISTLLLQKTKHKYFGTHSLNLYGVHAAESRVDMTCFFGNVQKLYILFSSCSAKWTALHKTASLSLHRLPYTRWSARIDAVKPLVKGQEK